MIAVSAMSRCFPYPPPGYERNGTHDKALIESIKLGLFPTLVCLEIEGRTGTLILQKEREKERRKEKKGKKKDKARVNSEIEKKKQSHEKRHKDESKVDQKGGDQKKRVVTEQLEKSSLTEEHGQPVSSQNLYDSSDSTQNSNKRKKHSSPSDGSHSHGSIVRIRLPLPLQKHKDPEVLSGNERACSTSGRPHTAAQEKYEIGPRPSREQPNSTSTTKTAAQEINPRPCKEQPYSTPGRTEILAHKKSETAPISSFFQSGSLPIESQFRDLIENWIPPPLQTEHTEFDDQEWLFEPNQQHRHRAKIIKARNDGSCNRNSNLWPSACYLPEAEIYALPFTVPY
ncbi:hypothetical protein HHK36_002939 [Tetracentron sinense]|uniref:Uncharacterized protein n=1 Tax=Tetracentron sinense TaxID=13715 RepID=A0A834ZRW9_TETSI|nr:hypothetical protein HHK36_002939 [Tetracentron sinense]